MLHANATNPQTKRKTHKAIKRDFTKLTFDFRKPQVRRNVHGRLYSGAIDLRAAGGGGYKRRWLGACTHTRPKERARAPGCAHTCARCLQC